MSQASIAVQTRRALGFFVAVSVISGVLGIWGAFRLGQTGLEMANVDTPRVLAVLTAETEIYQGQALALDSVSKGEKGRWADIGKHFKISKDQLASLTHGGESEAATDHDTQMAPIVESASVALHDIQLATKDILDSVNKGQGPGSEADKIFDTLFEDVSAGILALSHDPALAAQPDVQRLLGETRFELALGHLQIEESLAGDTTADFAGALALLDGAAARLLQIDVAAVSGMTGELADKISRLAATAQMRNASTLKVKEARLDAGKRFDAANLLFEAALHQAADLEMANLARGTAELNRAMTQSIILAALAGALTLGFALFGYRLISRRYIQRLTAVTGVMGELTHGNLAVEVPDWASNDEIGELRDSVGIFRTALMEREALEIETRTIRDREIETQRANIERERNELAEAERKAEAERDADSDRRARDHAIGLEIAEVVSACANGDFSRRLATDDKEGVFAELCDGLNQIGESASEGMGMVRDCLDALAHGDMSRRMPSTLKGVFQDIALSMNATADNLGTILSAISQATSNVSASTREIAGATDDLARRTEVNASTLEETANALEQMSASVKASAESAQQAKRSVDNISAKATASQNVVGQAVAAMDAIKQSSMGIARILQVIEEIAFQTNLLALNAGVEAARAGESGLGFAVVATEVRALAQRSSGASQEISKLIEESGANVKTGVELVNASGQVLQEIVANVNEVASKINEIFLSSHTTSTGITEISAAANQLDRATQQNAAMFEETNAAVRTLEDETQRLEKTVDAFRVAPKEQSLRWAG